MKNAGHLQGKFHHTSVSIRYVLTCLQCTLPILSLALFGLYKQALSTSCYALLYMPGCFLCLLAVSSVSVGELTIIFLLSEQFPIIQPACLAKHCRSSQLSLYLKDKMDICSDVILSQLNYLAGC